MKNPISVLVLSGLGISLLANAPARGNAREGLPVVHAAPASQVITVTVKDVRRARHGKEEEYLVAQAVGFPNDTCDVVTTFDVVKKYEERQTWNNVKQKIDIVVNGKAYPAKFRDFGFYPLGLNLACIDFESPQLHAELQIPALPLQADSPDPSELAYDDKEVAKSDPGTPFLNKEGQITAVLVGTENGALEFASTDEIRAFLRVAESISPWPALHRRPNSFI